MDQGTAILAAGAFAVISPVILSWMQDRARATERVAQQVSRSAERAEDFARQDAVADKAAEAAELLHASQVELVAKTDKVAEVAAVAVAENKAQLTQIHTLVNSNLTEALQGHLDQARTSLVLGQQVLALTRASGREPTPIELGIISSTEAQIAALDLSVANRAAQLALADTEVQDAADLAELTRRQNL